MRVFVVSDPHIDYPPNRQWLADLSHHNHVDDILILGGDVTDDLQLLEQCFADLSAKFFKVLFVPGNHDLWVKRCKTNNSIEKYQLICQMAAKYDISMEPFHHGSVSIVPLLSWYDFSFAQPCEKLNQLWMDFRACVWPDNMQVKDITEYFLALNEVHLHSVACKESLPAEHTLISFSHFLPRIDLMPHFVPAAYHYLYPALGSDLLEKQVRQLNPDIHIYGHSHLNRNVLIDGITYINNAFGYPSEGHFTRKELLCVFQG
jgi:predicted phosphodiesterase